MVSGLLGNLLQPILTPKTTVAISMHQKDYINSILAISPDRSVHPKETFIKVQDAPS
jgi:hypothetical protein